MAHLAASMMRDGGTILMMTYYGAEKVIENYNVMGAVKAALESSVRYLASEFGPLKIDTPADRIAPRTAGLQLNAVPAADRIRYPA
jgi:enoyl-[acyl-carrier-protein] reductase (NADH)